MTPLEDRLTALADDASVGGRPGEPFAGSGQARGVRGHVAGVHGLTHFTGRRAAQGARLAASALKGCAP